MNLLQFSFNLIKCIKMFMHLIEVEIWKSIKIGHKWEIEKNISYLSLSKSSLWLWG